jgi:hypothetical protein
MPAEVQVDKPLDELSTEELDAVHDEIYRQVMQALPPNQFDINEWEIEADELLP